MVRLPDSFVVIALHNTNTGLPLLYVGFLTVPLGFVLHDKRDYGYETAYVCTEQCEGIL
jgi:hypothetical protein